MSDEAASSSQLSAAQQARVEALQAARAVLVARTAIGTGKADPLDLIALARYIETGRDPYATEATP